MITLIQHLGEILHCFCKINEALYVKNNAHWNWEVWELREAETERERNRDAEIKRHTHINTYRGLSPAYSVLAGFGDGEAILIVSFSEVVTQELPKRDKMNKQAVTVISLQTHIHIWWRFLPFPQQYFVFEHESVFCAEHRD